MGIVLLYPGLTEELFYRGWLQRALRTWLRPGNAVLLTALLFGFLHLPEFIAVRYAGMFPIALSNMGDVILAGLIWGYGVTRTRSVLPWATVHALSNLAGF
jgi:membrane protease YdiL (CAAX protease family)